MADQKSNAGNIGDLIKHMLLLQIVKLYGTSAKRWTYFETHAGYYTYPVRQLRNQQDDWSGERQWSLGVIADADPSTNSEFVRQVQKYLRSGTYPGSIRWVHDSFPLAEHNFAVQGCDLKREAVESYPSELKRISVNFYNGYDKCETLDAESTLLFCDPFWSKDNAVRDMEDVGRIANRFKAIVVWYPINKTTLTNRFDQWRKCCGFSFIEFEFENYKVGGGWAGPDMRGAGMLLQGFNTEDCHKLINHGKELQSFFRGRMRGERNLNLRMTISIR
jgi:23S rRNA A2030 N6-methylase RlmJ